MFNNSDEETYDWSGVVDQNNLVNAGIYSEGTWVKEPVVVEFGTAVSDIGNIMFDACPTLNRVVIPDTVTHIGTYAFNLCPLLESVNLPSSVEWLGEGAFYGCTDLSDLVVPYTVKTIGQNAFHNIIDVTFQGRTSAQIQVMANYPWGLVGRAKSDMEEVHSTTVKNIVSLT